MAAVGSSFSSPLKAFGIYEPGSSETYGDASARLMQWRKNLVSSATFEARQGLRELIHEREDLKDLQADLKGLNGLVEAASQLHAGGSRLAEVVHQSNEAASVRASALEGVCRDLQQAADKKIQEAAEVEQARAEKDHEAAVMHEQALALLRTYKDRLGLDISRVAPETVRMAFSLLDERDPSREFSFVLGLSKDCYYVRDCAPVVPELNKLLEELNNAYCSVSALPRFVCSMRRCFLKAAGA